MNLIGKWKIAEVAKFDDEMNFIWESPEKVIASGEADANMLKAFMNFKEDGTVETLLPLPSDLPQSEIDEALAGGMVFHDGFAVMETRLWREKDGEYYFNDGDEGGEDITDWSKLVIGEDNKVDFGMFRLEKID